MTTSITLSLIALFGFGLTNFFWKFATPHKPYQPSYLMVQGATYLTVMALIHLYQKQPFTLTYKLSTIAIITGICASTGAICTFLALSSGGEGSQVFPIVGLNMVVATILSIIFFKEPVSTQKMLGLIFGVVSIVFLTR